MATISSYIAGLELEIHIPSNFSSPKFTVSDRINTSIMAEQAHQFVEFHDSGLPWLPTSILNDDIEACGDSGQDEYRLFSKVVLVYTFFWI